VAKVNGLELEIVDTNPSKGVSAEYLKLNKLGKVPTFVGADGYTLHECVAIAVYRMYQKPFDSILPRHDWLYSMVAMMKKMSFTVIPVLIFHVDFLLIRL
jgi:elongation factor 1-gamma